MNRLILKLILLLFVSAQAMAQERNVTGVVRDRDTNEPIAGVNVLVKGTQLGVPTDSDGRFSLSVPQENNALVFSFIGYATKEVTISASNVLEVTLESAAGQLEEVVITVGRGSQRTIIDNPVPVDNFNVKELNTTGQITFDKALQYRVPSFNTINTPVNDATTLLDPYEIRNLGPSRTLILINGKRKNLSSLLYVQFSPGRGETGADLSGIPTSAIKRVEILRDGASAQYGSDAIAGVMNVILKDKYDYSSLDVRAGITGKGDGESYGLSFNSGSNLAKGGFLNYTINVNKQASAVRSGKIDLETEATTFSPYGSYDLAGFQELTPDDLDAFGNPINPNGGAAVQADVDDWNNTRLPLNYNEFRDGIVAPYLAKYPDGNNINGSGDITTAGISFNMGLPIGEKGQFYSNGAYVTKKAKSFANFRTPYWKLDYGLLHVTDPSKPNYSGDPTLDANNDELYAGYIGYHPTFEGDLADYNATVGIKNELGGWNNDVSLTFGGNKQTYTVNNTVNHSLGAAGPTSYKPGGYSFRHVVANLDLSKAINDKLFVAVGSEARTETYQIIAGDTASYSGEGANSFPGIREENARTNSRMNIGVYADVTYDITDNFLVEGAYRFEQYSDFGSANVGKLSSRLKLAEDRVVLRASVSSGFRAPTLHQIYAQSTQASFADGTIVNSGLFNNVSKEAFLLGVPRLKPEKSINISFGAGLNLIENLSVSVDYYSINIKDRIVYSSSITTDDTGTALYNILQAGNLSSAQFFINGIETQTNGIDLVINYKDLQVGPGKLGVNVAGNFVTENKIVGSPNDPKAIKDANATILNQQVKSLLTKGRPQYKMIAGIDYSLNKFNVVLNNTLFGPTEFQDLDNDGDWYDARMDANNIKQVFSAAVVTDLNIGYTFNENLSASFSINNLLDVLPKWKLKALNADGEEVLSDPQLKSLMEGFLTFSGRYNTLGYNGSQFSQLGRTFALQLTYKF